MLKKPSSASRGHSPRGTASRWPPTRSTRNSTAEPSERKAEADVRAKSEREMRHAVADQVEPVGVGKGASVAVGRIHHQENAVAGLDLLAVQAALGLGDAHLGADRAIVAQQLLD